MIRYEYFEGSIPADYLGTANKELTKLFNVRNNPEYLLSKDTNAIFAIYVTEKETRAGKREIKVPAAFISLETYESKPYIGWLVTFKEFQGRGLASSLIKLCQERLDVLTLHEDSTNERLKNFYLKMGFHIIGSRDVPDSYGGLLKQYYMEWTKFGGGRIDYKDYKLDYNRMHSMRRALIRCRSLGLCDTSKETRAIVMSRL